MYFSIKQSPELKHCSQSEQKRIVGATLATYGNWTLIRGVAMSLSAVSLPVTIASSMSDSGNYPAWLCWLVAASGGLIFYLYLLWEINGPFLLNVKRYLAATPPPQPPESRWATAIVAIFWMLLVALGWLLLFGVAFLFWLVVFLFISRLVSSILHR